MSRMAAVSGQGRRFLAVLAWALTASVAQAGPDICGCWTPQPGQIVNMEKQLRGGGQLRGKLEDYGRYYAGGINGNRKFIRAQLLPLAPGEASSIHVVTGRKMTPLQAEGCIGGYDILIARLLYVACAAPGAWTPTKDQIAAPEQNVTMPAGAAPAALFLRNYAGVTEQGRRVIQAVYVRDDNPGIIIASEAELPTFSEGGCMVVKLRYDPATGQTLESNCAEGG
jgi:hypothetical protein